MLEIRHSVASLLYNDRCCCAYYDQNSVVQSGYAGGLGAIRPRAALHLTMQLLAVIHFLPG